MTDTIVVQKPIQIPFDPESMEIPTNYDLPEPYSGLTAAITLAVVGNALRNVTMRPVAKAFLIEFPEKIGSGNVEIEGKRFSFYGKLPSVVNFNGIEVGFGTWLNTPKPLLLVQLFH